MTPARRSRFARTAAVLEVVLLIGGLALLAAYGAAHVHGALGSRAALEAFAADTRSASVVPSHGRRAETARHLTVAASAEPDQKLWGGARIAAYRASVQTVGESAIGVLAIPSIDLRAPIFEGTGEPALNRGVGRIEGTGAIDGAGNLGIAGHRDGFFRGLKDIALGDFIGVESRGGSRRYRVTDLMVVEPTDVHVLDPTAHATLTLVTCYPFYFIGAAPRRFIVKAIAID